MARKPGPPANNGKRRDGTGPRKGQPGARTRFLARNGVPAAQFRLGQMYLVGEDGVQRDAEKAVRWFRAAAKQGLTDAQVMLAECYREGDGVEEDYEEAARWLRAAADAGDTDASFELGMMYADLLVGMDDDPVAERRLADVAAAGYPPAQMLMAAFRGELDGVEDLDIEGFGLEDVDPEVAREFVEDQLKKAWRGDVEAQSLVADAYRMGIGVPEDHAEARRWYRAAAKQGDAGAQNNLAVSYTSSEGGERDLEEGMRWLRLAAEQGVDDARWNLEEIEATLRGP